MIIFAIPLVPRSLIVCENMGLITYPTAQREEAEAAVSHTAEDRAHRVADNLGNTAGSASPAGPDLHHGQRWSHPAPQPRRIKKVAKDHPSRTRYS
jgi:hypothetical protein